MTYTVRVAVRGMESSWLHTKARAGSALKALAAVEADEIANGYSPVALWAENDADAHDIASKGVWPFAVGGPR